MFAIRLTIPLVSRCGLMLRLAAARGDQAMAAWRAWRRRERDARALQEMNDRDLNDIGLGRSDLPFVVSSHLDDRRRDGWW